MLISIEGIDGAGKGTQAKQLLENTRRSGYTSELISFPRYTFTQSSKMVAAYLNGEFGRLEQVPPAFAATLFALDRMESRVHIEQLCEQHQLVIVDRYVASNLAYQSARITMPERIEFMEWLLNLEYEVFDLPKPDLTLFLDIPTQTSKELVAQKGTRNYTDDTYDLHERDSSYLSNVRQIYHWLIGSHYLDPCTVINCLDRQGELRDVKEIGQNIYNLVVQHLSNGLKTDTVN